MHARRLYGPLWYLPTPQDGWVVKLSGVVLGVVVAASSPVVTHAQEAAPTPPTQRFSLAMRSVGDSAVVYGKLLAWKMTVMLRYELSMAVQGRVDSMPPYPLDSLRMLRDSGYLEYAEYDRTTGGSTTTDAMLPSWGLDSLRVSRAWANGLTGDEVLLAVMDTGFETQHPEFAGRVERCISFVPIDTTTPMVCRQTVADCNHHGTHVASTALGATRGVAPGARLMAIKIFEDVNGDCLAWGSIRTMALTYARTHGAQVVNISTGSGTGLPSERTAVQAAFDAGVVVCGASGNANGYQALFPGAFAGALSIGALTSNLTRASYSNRDTLDLDFAFPGSGINGAIGSSGYGSKNGTSMASPHCAGYFALLKQALPSVSVDSLWSLARLAAKDLGTAGRDPLYGFGMPRADIGAALALGLSTQPTSTAGTLTFAGVGTQCAPVDSPVEWTLSGAPGLTITREPNRVCVTVTDPTPRTVDLTLSSVP